MITISKEIEFDAGHRVPGHESKCRNPHGHRYRVRVTCQGQVVTEKGAPDEGMLVDFGDLKTLMTHRVHDVLDHGFIVHELDQSMRAAFLVCGSEQWKVIVLPVVPTAENIAQWIWDQLDEPISERFRDDLRLHRVEVWETPTSLAVVERDPAPSPITVNLNAMAEKPSLAEGLRYMRRRYGDWITPRQAKSEEGL